MEDGFPSTVRYSDELPRGALGCHLLCVESRLHTERASGSTLAGETVADRDSNGLSFYGEPELLATTSGVSSDHERDRRQVASGDIPEYWLTRDCRAPAL